ncbi:hypothetical protein [Mycolicibacterium sphagni]|uniref:SecA family profile domain-containing protein n=1 Tax=Mycolicibacterium sphagni TaxID=1786 RepID=A0A255DKB2_9MYCO|nr:hypothetical protein [Mycolicibacterium sphagni]MCV7178359.1 hypothetical protein [Mycolicibacterium sphagni]OYN79838.1 hypothetical protein CG716_10200 [Mycolicibacterium sphagni]
MTAAIALEKRQLDRAEQLQQLRRQMAAVSGKVGVAGPVADVANEAIPASESLLEIPESLAGPLPKGLPRGVVAVVSGARSLPVSMAAAVTAGGGHVAVVGLPDFGLLAAAEMGADLSRLAVIPDPGTDPVEVAAVLMDGMDLVVLGLAGGTVTATRARAVVARARQKGCTLLVARGDWQGATMRLDARVSGYETTAGRGGAAVPGSGRISRVRLSVRAHGRVTRSRVG